MDTVKQQIYRLFRVTFWALTFEHRISFAPKLCQIRKFVQRIYAAPIIDSVGIQSQKIQFGERIFCLRRSHFCELIAI